MDVTPTPAPPGTPTIISVGAALLQQGKVLPSFAQFAMTGEDNVRITVCGSVAGVTIKVQGRFLDTTTSQVLPFGFAVPLSSNRVAASTFFALGTGYLLNLTAFAESGSPIVLGQAYVKVDIVRGLTGATYLLGSLVGGYVTNNQAIGFPGSPILGSLEGEPAIRAITGTTPVQGIEVSEFCPTGARWELIAFFCNLTTVNVGPSRFPRFVGLMSGITPWYTVQANGIPAGVNGYLTFAENLPPAAEYFSDTLTFPTPQRTLFRAGDGWQTLTFQLNALDQYTNVFYAVREWLEVN